MSTRSAALRRWAPWIALGLIVAVGMWLRSFMLSSPIAGYHLFNEGFYTDAAVRDAGRGLFAWLLEPGDFNNPPLYTLVTSLLIRVFGGGLTLVRAVSVAAGLATVVLLFFLGRTLYSTRIGLLAAGAFALMPGAVLVTRNAQVDALLVMLQVASVLAYVLAVKRDDDRLALAAGALLGLALITKMPAVLVLGGLMIWDTWRARGFAWLRRRRNWMYLAGFVALGAPWHLVQLARNATLYLGAQAGVGSSAEAPGAVFWRYLLYEEVVWLHWPLFALTALAGVGYIGWRRTTGDKLVLAMLAVNFLFYLVFHMHSYYLLTWAPFTALAAARLLDAGIEKAPVPGWSATAMLAAGLVLASLVMLAGHKFAPVTTQEVQPAIGPGAAGADLWADEVIWGNIGPALDISVPEMTVRRVPQGLPAPDRSEIATDRPSYFITVNPGNDPQTGEPFPQVASLEDRPQEVVVFGVGVSQTPELGYNLFVNGPWKVRWGAYPVTTFGLRPLAPVPAGIFIYDFEDLLGTSGG